MSTPSQDEIIEYRPHFQNLKSINLRKCNMLEWSQVLHVSQMWTNIETLALQENKLVDLPMPETCPVLSKLEYACINYVLSIEFNQFYLNFNRNLDLQQNRLTNFQEIINLGRLNALKYLNLSENLLTDIEFPDCDPMKWLNIFENLIEINLRENPIQDEVNKLLIIIVFKLNGFYEGFHIQRTGQTTQTGAHYVHIDRWFRANVFEFRV